MRELLKQFHERRTGSLLVVLVAIGAALRFFRIGSESYWHDEGYSLYTSRTLGYAEIAFLVPWQDSHPPLYYLLLRLWTQVVGYSEVATRALSAVLGVLAIVVLFLVARELYDETTGLIAAAFLALSEFQIYYAQETRMYMLLLALCLLSYLFFVRVLDSPSRVSLAGYTLTVVALGYTHVFGLFVPLAQGLYLLVSSRIQRDTIRASLENWTQVQGMAAVLLLPYVTILLSRMVGGRPEAVSWIPVPSLAAVVATPVVHFGWGRDLVPSLLVFAFIGVLAMGAVLNDFSLRPRLGSDRQERPSTGNDRAANSTLLVLLWAAVPILIPTLFSYLVSPIYTWRYTIVAAGGVYLLVARGIRLLDRRWLRVGVVALMLVVLIYPLPVYYAEDQKEQWRDVTNSLQANADSDDIVIVTNRNQVVLLDYYYTDEILTAPIVEGRSYEMPDGVQVVFAPQDTDTDHVRSAVRHSDNVWFISRPIEGRVRPEKLERVTGVVTETHPAVVRQGYQGIHLYRYAKDPASAPKTQLATPR